MLSNQAFKNTYALSWAILESLKTKQLSLQNSVLNILYTFVTKETYLTVENQWIYSIISIYHITADSITKQRTI